MKIATFVKVLVSTLVLAGSAFAASSPTDYVASYKGRTDIPVPLAVVVPEADEYSEGTVTLEFVVNAQGKPEGISVKAGSDFSLADAATSAVAKWKFEPKKLNGQAVAAKVVLPVRFVVSAD
jgi:TonB family protein